MSNAREAIAAACQYISILKIENQNIEKQRDELLEALKATMEALKTAWDNRILPASVFSHQILRKNKEAIDKAEGKS